MAELVIHQQSRLLLDRYIDEPAHAILLAGGIGVGLGSIAQYAAHRLTEPAHITIVRPDNGTIPIATVRELYAHTKTKQSHPQVIIIDDADAMKHEAQNALLKLLEEPTSAVYFILTSHYPQLLLATIRSRVQAIPIRPVPSSDSQAFIRQLAVDDKMKLRQILFIANGRPAEIYRLASDEEYFKTQSTKATDARSFLGSVGYDRLILVSKYNSRDDALEFLEMLGRFSVHTLYSQPDTAAAKRLEAINSTIERISGNGHIKTQLTRLIMEWA